MRLVLLPVTTLVLSRSVRSFAPIRRSNRFLLATSFPRAFRSNMTPSPSPSPSASAALLEEDAYTWLEEVESEESLNFAKAANEKCLEALGDPVKSGTGTYDKVLAVLESDDRIPHAGKYGNDDDGEEIMVNFWKDSKNPKGIWRKTTMSSYRTENPEWTTILDIDELAEKDGISWVWKGASALPRARDALSNNGKRVTRALLNLSRGGSDAAHYKEFDFLTGEFVTENAFNLPEAKSRVSWKSRDVVIVGSDFGPDSLTDSGYPRQIREWVRGTNVEDAPVVFEGEKKDVSVGAYISDERHHGGGIYEVRYRSTTFYTSKKWMRKVKYEHLLAPDDPQRKGVEEAGEFIELAIQDDADGSIIGNMLLISLRSDWEPIPGGKTYKQGSTIYTDVGAFLEKGQEGCDYEVLFEPTERTACEYWSTLKDYVVLSIMDNVKTRYEFYRIAEDGTSLKLVAADEEPLIRASDVRPVDSTYSNKFWFVTSGYTQPSTLYIADAAKVENEGYVPDVYIEEELKSLPSQYDASDLETIQMVAISDDGTEVPYFIVKKKDTVLDGNTPTLLYGYGGFEISLGPKYIATVGLSWLERGGAYVEANIRGGGEFGPSWHQAALKANRNKSYEDFSSVAKHLIAQNICKASTLAARGGSNGGLLMGNMYTMYPDLFGAIHCAVPLLDMKRYHTLLAGASWMAEFGDPDTDDWDEFLNKYSPYHNIDGDRENYPPMIVTTSTRDDRVHPAHARKMVKKLWDMGEGKNWPIYYYENIEGGHGGAADAKQSAFMTALAYDFMWDTLTSK